MSAKADKTTKSKLFGIFVLIGALSYLSFWSLPGLFEQYSFWRDEIFTAAFISGSWVELFRDWIGPDVHPPLYFIATKIWASFLGNSELSLRGFSFVFAIATIILLWKDWRQKKTTQRLIALLFIVCSPTFLYYSQEARSYTLVLFLSSAVLLRVFDHRYKAHSDTCQVKRNAAATYALCIALSLTHYFGFIFSFFILAIDIWDQSISRNRFTNILVIGIICLWPAFHIGFLGNLGGVQQEKLSNLTTTFTPVLSTLESYIYSSIYYINSGIRGLNILMIIISATAIIGFCLAEKMQLQTLRKSKTEFNYSILLISSIIVSLALVETFWPITTARNFIILLYPTSIAIGSVFEASISGLNSNSVKPKTIGVLSLAGLSMILLLSSKISINNLGQKINHGIDYKSLALHLKANNLCKNGCLTLDYDPQGNNFGDRIDNYYFGDLQLFSLKEIDMQRAYSTNSLPIVGSYKTKAEILNLAKQLPDRQLITSCSNDIEPYQSTPFILIARGQEASHRDYPCITNQIMTRE